MKLDSFFIHSLYSFIFDFTFGIKSGEVDSRTVKRLDSSTNLEIQAYFFSVQSLSCVWLFATPWTAARHASLSITNSQSLFKFTSIESVIPSNHIIFCYPLFLPPSTFPSIRVFPNESVLCISWPKCRSFSIIISPSNDYSELISFRMDWFDLPAV